MSALWLAIGGMCALAAAMGIGRFGFTPVLPHMLTETGLSIQAAGLIASANFLGYFLGALASAIVPEDGRLVWTRAALAASVATTAAMALTLDPLVWGLIRFASGVASAFVFVFAASIVLDGLARAGRSTLSAVLYAGVGVGIALSAIATHVVTEAGGGFAAQWNVLAAITAVLSCVVVATVRDGGEGAAIADGPAHQRLSATASAAFVRLVLAYGLFGFGYVVTATFLVAMLREVSADRTVETLAWLLVGVAAAPSVAVWVAVGRRLSMIAAFRLALVVEAIGVAASAISSAPVFAGAAAILLGGTFMGATALGLIAARELQPNTTRQAVSLMTASFAFGQMLGPSSAGALSAATGSFSAASWLAALALIAAALLARSAFNAVQR